MARRPLALTLAAVLAASVSLSACSGGGGTSTPAPTPTPTPTPTPGATLQSLTHQPPVGVFLAMLLTDGTVMVQANPATGPGSSAGDFYRLTPDATGSYAAGTWTHLAPPPTGYAPYASAEAVLADGRVLFVGGEYNQDQYTEFSPSALTNMSAVFDPVANHWTMIAPPPGQPYIGDVPSSILPDGRFIFGSKFDRKMWSLDPATLSWTAIAATGKSDNFSEEGFTQLPGGVLLTVDMVNTPQSEHFVSATNSWISDGPTPVSLTSPTTVVGGLAYGPAPLQVVGGVSYGPGPPALISRPARSARLSCARTDRSSPPARRGPARPPTPPSIARARRRDRPGHGRPVRISPAPTTRAIPRQLCWSTVTSWSRVRVARSTSSMASTCG